MGVRGGWGFSAWLDDLHVYDPVSMSWTQLYSNNAPSARYGHGFTFAVGKIWVQGGYGFIAATDGYGLFSCPRALASRVDF